MKMKNYRTFLWFNKVQRDTVQALCASGVVTCEMIAGAIFSQQGEYVRSCLEPIITQYILLYIACVVMVRIPFVLDMALF